MTTDTCFVYFGNTIRSNIPKKEVPVYEAIKRNGEYHILLTSLGEDTQLVLKDDFSKAAAEVVGQPFAKDIYGRRMIRHCMYIRPLYKTLSNKLVASMSSIAEVEIKIPR
jgi:hypothetical protein